MEDSDLLMAIYKATDPGPEEEPKAPGYYKDGCFIPEEEAVAYALDECGLTIGDYEVWNENREQFLDWFYTAWHKED